MEVQPMSRTIRWSPGLDVQRARRQAGKVRRERIHRIER